MSLFMNKKCQWFMPIWFMSQLCAHSLQADNDKLFADDAEQYAAVPLEVDPSYEDDFAHIEMEDEHGVGGQSFRPGLLIEDSYDIFSARDLVRRDKSLSVFLGNETIASRYHFLLYPQVRFSAWRLFGHVGLPLRFPIYDNVKKNTQGIRHKGFVDAESAITPRGADFRSGWDIQRIIRHVELNRPQDNYFARLSRSHTITLGHGELVHGLSPEGLYDQDPLFLSGHANFNAARLSGFVAPIFKASMLGLSARFTPLSMLDAPALVQNINFDATYVGDLTAPNGAKKFETSYVLEADRRSVKRHKGGAHGLVLGSASEIRPIAWLGLKPYVSWGQLWLTSLKGLDDATTSSYGGGLHVGPDVQIEFLPKKRSLLSFKSEGRLFSKNYYPGYFGSTYLIDRHIFNEPKNTRISNQPITKSQYVKEGGDQRFRFGYLFELGYAYDEAFSTMLGYENARSFAKGAHLAPYRKLSFVTSILGADALKFYLGYQATSIDDLKELFDFEKSRALLSLRGQLKLMPFLYFDTWVKHSFGIYDMFTSSTSTDAEALWLSNMAETRSLNFGLGLELAMTF